jgi:PAS domain S-box-containing protein
MKVKEVMTLDPIVLTASMKIKEAASILSEHRIDGAPVVDEKGFLEGIFTKTHVLRAVSQDINGVNYRVGDLMTTKVVTISPEIECEEAAKLKIGRLLVVNNDGKIIGILTHSDLLRAFVNEVNNTLGKLNAIIDSTHNAIISVNKDGEIELFNHAAEQLTGVKKEKAKGVKIDKIITSVGIYKQLYRGISEHSHKLVVNQKKLISNQTPILRDGEIVGAVSILQDISELENISKELEATRELSKELEAIIDSSFDGIFVTDKTGKVLRINKAYERITGIKAEQVVGRTMTSLVAAGVYSRSVSMMVIEEKKPVTIAQSVNTSRDVLVTGNPIFDSQGDIFRIVTNVRDITELNDLRQELEKAQEMEKLYYLELEQLRNAVNNHCEAVVVSKEMQDIMELVTRVSGIDVTVLVLGESGVGKEVVVKILHNKSRRNKGPFIKVNCGAIPEHLLESELFGYEGGAFTGAKKEGKPGMFQLANQGTLFLDEIGEMPMNLQVKLLRVLAEREITRVGGTKPIPVDVRIVVATNRNLEEMVKQGLFREDLYYRLNVVPIVIPPLRSRKEDIPSLALHFLDQFNSQYGVEKKLSYEVIQCLMEYDWPGNVRELKNVIERMVVTTPSNLLAVEHIPKYLAKETMDSNKKILVNGIIPLSEAVEEVEKQIIYNAMNKHKTTRKIAAVLGVDQSTIVRKIQKYALNKTDVVIHH